MKINQYFGLARPIDFRYASNRAIAFITLLLLFLGTVYQFFLGKDMPESLGWGLQLCLSALLTWMLARELDADHLTTSFLALPFAVGAFLYTQQTDLLLLAGLVLLPRILSRISGQPARTVESAGMLALGAFLSYQGKGAFGLALALAFWLDSRMPPALPRHRWYGLAMLLVVLTALLQLPFLQNNYSLSAMQLSIMLISSLPFLLLTLKYRHPESRQDYSSTPVDGKRMQAGQWLALAAVLLYCLYAGEAAFWQTAAFWSVLTAASLLFVYRSTLRY